jgi:hypothetical protein
MALGGSFLFPGFLLLLPLLMSFRLWLLFLGGMQLRGGVLALGERWRQQ